MYDVLDTVDIVRALNVYNFLRRGSQLYDFLVRLCVIS